METAPMIFTNRFQKCNIRKTTRGPERKKTSEPCCISIRVCPGVTGSVAPPAIIPVWAGAMGCESKPRAPDLSFALYNGLIQSVKSDMGVAIGHSAMIRHELEAGDLVAFHTFAIPSPASYFLVTRQNALKNSKLAAFRSWILSCSEGNM